MTACDLLTSDLDATYNFMYSIYHAEGIMSEMFLHFINFPALEKAYFCDFSVNIYIIKR